MFFDVRVPMMRQSMVWSLRMMMDQDDAANLATISDLRKSLQGVTDPATRVAIEKAVRQLETRTPGAARNHQRVGPTVVMPDSANPAVGAAAATGISAPRPAAMPPADSVWATTRTRPTPKRSRARSSTR